MWKLSSDRTTISVAHDSSWVDARSTDMNSQFQIDQKEMICKRNIQRSRHLSNHHGVTYVLCDYYLFCALSLFIVPVNRFESDFLIYSPLEHRVNLNSMDAHTHHLLKNVLSVLCVLTAHTHTHSDPRCDQENEKPKIFSMLFFSMNSNHRCLQIVDTNFCFFFFSLFSLLHSYNPINIVPIHTLIWHNLYSNKNPIHSDASNWHRSRIYLNAYVFHRSTQTQTHIWINFEPNRQKMPSSDSCLRYIVAFPSNRSFYKNWQRSVTFRTRHDFDVVVIVFCFSSALRHIYLFVERFVLHLSWEKKNV